ncbi:MAG: sigma-54-dependent Fis family transcriptional regulator [Bacteroidetes bacterium]|nr:sigma-54-dependent Fis family transcriptional regulator [Bacteroidota bacterium]
MPTVFVVEDERILRVTIADDLRDAGYKVFEFADAVAALTLLQNQEADIIISDIKMPRMDGLDFLKRVKEINPDIYVVMMTAFATVETAVQAIKLGAYDFLTKPFPKEQPLLIIQRIQELKTIKADNKILRTQLIGEYDFSSFIGDETETKSLFGNVKIVSNSQTTVLISGETGTGKELLANILHYNSNRNKERLIKVSCAILSREIFESELFGHEKGAFTGADKIKIGRFELADKGTLYLDDIDDMPMDLQVKLLRVLEQMEIERVGGMQTIKIDVRLIASTKHDLKKLVGEGKFREDLFFRLNVFPIHLKPLREKKGDIVYLLNHFIKQFSGGKEIKMEEEVLQLLKKYNWPGNVRELKNLVERIVLLAQDNKITASLIPIEIKYEDKAILKTLPGDKPLDEHLNDIEYYFIIKTLEKCGGNKSNAAKLLGLPLSTLRTKMEKHKIPF